MPEDDWWVREVVALYVRSEDMTVAELEALLEVAVRGERPEYPGLSAYKPLLMATELR